MGWPRRLIGGMSAKNLTTKNTKNTNLSFEAADRSTARKRATIQPRALQPAVRVFRVFRGQFFWPEPSPPPNRTNSIPFVWFVWFVDNLFAAPP
jgi:hypothetical protein